jgi:hypothetical protein
MHKTFKRSIQAKFGAFIILIPTIWAWQRVKTAKLDAQIVSFRISAGLVIRIPNTRAIPACWAKKHNVFMVVRG